MASTIAGNSSGDDRSGGGIYLNRSGPPLRIRGTTISGNRAGINGGGLFALSPVTLRNSTVASNRADRFGGGIHASGGVALNAVTVARNVGDADDEGTFEVGAGLSTQTSSKSAMVENSLISRNRLGSGERNDCAGPVDSLGHNLLSTRGPFGACDGFDRATDRVRNNPRIGKLKRNGGPTKTIALRKRSAALNKAKRRTAPNRDQRGERRGRKKDIGAYERNRGR